MLAAALLAERPDLDRPGELWRMVQRTLAGGWRPSQPAEAAAMLAEASELILDPLADGQPPDWQWNLAIDLTLLERLAGGEPVTLTAALLGIRANVIAHLWHIDQTGTDRLADIRWRFVELLGRVVMDTEPLAWELTLLDRPPGVMLYAGPAERIRRRREAAGLNQTQLARAVGADRTTVVRWEKGTRRPTSHHADALTRELGGQHADYVAP